MMEYKEVQASSIQPGRDDSPVTYEQLQHMITQYVGTLNFDLLESQMFSQGQAKQPPTKLKISILIQSLNMLMLDYIKTNNQTDNVAHSNIINDYFAGVNRLSKVLDSTDIKVAETQILCYIMGYLLKLINHFKQSEK